ncbi:MAG: mechanosensitive ion channel [Candidatus Aminicenantes bacterium]|nr:mechanosensitive ion channel [Candidatus Aminicenantes bacterium]
MNWHFSLPVTFLFLIVIFFYLSKKREIFYKLKTIIPALLILFSLSLIISILKIDLIANLFSSEQLDFILWLLVFFLTLIVLVKISTFFVFDFLLSIRRDVRNVRLFRDIFVIILYVIGILFIIKYYLNIEITVILASSAVLTVVVGFALQDVLGDLFSGIALTFEESLQIGDWVRIGEFEGKIEQLCWRAIILRTIDNVLVLIPNQKASKEEVLNYGSADRHFALRMIIGASYRNSPDRVIDSIQRVLKTVDSVMENPAPMVLLKEFDDFSVNYEVRFWLKDYAKKDMIKSEIRRKTWYEFKRQKIQIPFPIRDVYIKKEKGETITSGEIFEVLKNNELLKTIDPALLSHLAEHVEIDTYGAGEILINEGETSRYFFLVIEGEVDIIKDRKIFHRLTDNDYFGEISIFTGEKTSATVKVAAESKVLKIPSEKFKEVLKINEQTAKQLSQVIAVRKSKLSELEKEKPVSSTAIKKDSETIFQRMKKYFMG